MAEKTFKRKTNYNTAIDDAKEFLKQYGDEILPIPSVNGIICYYQGKPVVEIKDLSWTFFGKGKNYNKYLLDENNNETDALKCMMKCKTKEDKKSFYWKYKSDILHAIGRGLEDDKERFSQQDIILRSLHYQKQGYVVCGMETTIPDLSKTSGKTKDTPEIDIVAIHPEQKKILLIEYKCTEKALLNNDKNNIYGHAKDYAEIRKWASNDQQFITNMLNAYKVFCEIYGRSYDETQLCAEDYSVEIVFLLTNYPSKGKCSPDTQPLTRNNYESAKNLLQRPDVVNDTENAYYLTYNHPEDIVDFPEDILSSRYKGIDKLSWNEDWSR